MESIGFKEWSLVCDALGRGEQSLILRKGGIAEGRAGFSFAHREFFLFPTFFHEQVGKLRTAAVALPADNGEIAISLFAKVGRAVVIRTLEKADALAPLHVLSPEVVRERFQYKQAGLNVAFVRVFRLEQPWRPANDPRFGGCRSWVHLPESPSVKRNPVLDAASQARHRHQFDAIVDG